MRVYQLYQKYYLVKTISNVLNTPFNSKLVVCCLLAYKSCLNVLCKDLISGKCQALSSVTNGRYSPDSCTTSFRSAGFACSLICNTGYTPMSINTTTCFDTGAWSHQISCAGIEQSLRFVSFFSFFFIYLGHQARSLIILYIFKKTIFSTQIVSLL